MTERPGRWVLWTARIVVYVVIPAVLIGYAVLWYENMQRRGMLRWCKHNVRILYVAMRALSSDTDPQGQWPWGSNLKLKDGDPVGTGSAWWYTAVRAGEVEDNPRLYRCAARGAGVRGRSDYVGPIVPPSAFSPGDVLGGDRPGAHDGYLLWGEPQVAFVTLGGDTLHPRRSAALRLPCWDKVGE